VAFDKPWARKWGVAQHDGYERAATAMLAGAPDESALRQAFPGPEAILRAAPYLADHRLSIFHSDTDYFIYRTLQIARHKPLSDVMSVNGTWCAGAVDDARKVEEVGSSSEDWTLVWGWAIDREATAKVDAVVFVDDAGRLVGAGRVLFPRWDVAAALKVERRFLLHYLGYVDVEQGRSITAYAFKERRNDLCRFGEMRIPVRLARD